VRPYASPSACYGAALTILPIYSGRQNDPYAPHQQNGPSKLGGGSYANKQGHLPQQHQLQQQNQYRDHPQQHQGYPTPQPPSYHDPQAGGGAARFETPSQQQGYGGAEIVSPAFSRGTSTILKPDVEDGGEDDVKPHVGASWAAGRGASETPKKNKDRLPVGSLVQAKMFDPRDKNVYWPCMVSSARFSRLVSELSRR
jgi:hypothetical protein